MHCVAPNNGLGIPWNSQCGSEKFTETAELSFASFIFLYLHFNICCQASRQVQCREHFLIQKLFPSGCYIVLSPCRSTKDYCAFSSVLFPSPACLHVRVHLLLVSSLSLSLFPSSRVSIDLEFLVLAASRWDEHWDLLEVHAWLALDAEKA